MRKGYTKFVPEDFDEYPVWELQGSLTTAEPYQGKLPFQSDRSRAYFVRTSFTLADKTVMSGWVMIGVPPYQIYSLHPTILTGAGPVSFTRLAKQPKEKDVQEALRRLGKTSDEVFPLQFGSDVPVPNGPASGKLKGFLHRLTHYDDHGRPQDVDFFYRTAAELDSALRAFHQKEQAAKAALEPSKEEMALLKASKAGDVAKVTSLLAKGVNPNRGGTIESGGYTRKNLTPLMLAAEGNRIEVIAVLLKSGADVQVQDESNEPRVSGRTALGYACRHGHVEAARLLLEAGSDPNHRLSFGQTVFDEVCYEGSMELIRLLLRFRANPNASCGKSDDFALKQTVLAGRLDVAELLVEHKADVNGSDKDGETALMRASGLVRQKIVQFLLDNRADVSATTASKRTALHSVVEAAASLDPAYDKNAAKQFLVAMHIVKVLIGKGADVNAMTKYGDTPLTMAKGCNFPELSKYLVSKGAA